MRQELIETRKREEDERKERADERRRHRDEVDRISQERTLKESELLSQLKEKDSMLESQRHQLLSSR